MKRVKKRIPLSLEASLELWQPTVEEMQVQRITESCAVEKYADYFSRLAGDYVELLIKFKMECEQEEAEFEVKSRKSPIGNASLKPKNDDWMIVYGIKTPKDLLKSYHYLDVRRREELIFIEEAIKKIIGIKERKK